MPALKVAIVGCGTAGQASAVLLARLGATVEIFDRADRLDPVGAGLLLQPTGMDVLREIGAADDVLRLATPVRRLLGSTSGGRTVLDLSYEDRRPELFGVGVLRGTLFAALQRHVLRAGVPVHTATPITRVTTTPTNQRLLHDQRGRRHGPYDLVVVADGARSSLREGLGLVKRSTRYPWGAMWFVAKDPRNTAGETLHQCFEGTGRMLGVLPSGKPHEKSRRRVSIFWSERVEVAEALRRRGLGAFRDAVRRLTKAVDPFLDQLETIDEVIIAPYYDVVCKSVCAGPVVLLGDAAHATSPQLGQGANLALADASTLARCLRERATIRTALEVYERERRSTVRFYQTASRWLTPLFQSNHEWLAPLRDRIVPAACRVGWTRRYALSVLCGERTGPLRSIPGQIARSQAKRAISSVAS
jgi:2-polyprenyl-6-methoxyphenol hydroxylase-like FAD-dependent oxidoreductase